MSDKPSPDQIAATEANAQVTSTSGEAPGMFEAYGISGLNRYGAMSRVYEEFLRELQGPQGMKNYREMMDNDPVIGAILYASTHLCQKVGYRINPADKTQEAGRIAEKIGSMIFNDMETTWSDTISEILTMLPFGWANMEMRLKRRLGNEQSPFVTALPDLNAKMADAAGYPAEFPVSRFDDGLIGFHSWSMRSQETLFQWEFDVDSKPTVMQQMAAPDFRVRRIPLGKCLQFKTQSAKGNPEGRSIIRNAWTSYYLKKNLQVFEGIGIERDLAGYPVLQTIEPDAQKGIVSPDIWNSANAEATAQLNYMKQLVRSIRRDEQEGMVLPYWVKFSLVSTGSRRAFDTNAIIQRYDQRIAQSVLADFVMLGHEAVGSKAMAATKISLFTSSLSSFIDSACAVINRVAFPLLMRVNAWPEALTPTLEHGEVENVNLMELGAFIKDIAGLGFNPLKNPAAQKAVMDAARLPTIPGDLEELEDMPLDTNTPPLAPPSGGPQ